LVELKDLLENIGKKPLIVRPSSLLEDNFGTAFAGKYDIHFCPNQGSPKDNLEELTHAIAGTFASTLKPEALLYRRSKGLQDYDERMAILIQLVQGDSYGRYFLPHGAGVAFSHNLYRRNQQIRREDGFARLVWGLGTRAVERVGNDYPRPVALSHPTLQPDDTLGNPLLFATICRPDRP
jgi:phosphoenolpyruvate synthase/pyruvate phosphate dikinase